MRATISWARNRRRNPETGASDAGLPSLSEAVQKIAAKRALARAVRALVFRLKCPEQEAEAIISRLALEGAWIQDTTDLELRLGHRGSPGNLLHALLTGRLIRPSVRGHGFDVLLEQPQPNERKNE